MKPLHHKQGLALATLISALAFGGTAHAQMTLEEIIVTAQKREQSLQEVPISVDVVSAEALDRRAINDTRSLAQASPSLNFQDGHGPQAVNFNIRGLGSYTIEGGLQPSVSLVVDGVPYARNGEFVTELADIERVEVLRGPQGTLFGRNSTGGAINITTKRPADEFEAYVDVSATTDEEQLYRAMLSAPLSATARTSILAISKDRDGHIENIHPQGEDLGGEDSWGLRAKLDIDFSDNLNGLFTIDMLDSTHGFSPQVDNRAENLAFNGVLREHLQGNGGNHVIPELPSVIGAQVGLAIAQAELAAATAAEDTDRIATAQAGLATAGGALQTAFVNFLTKANNPETELGAAVARGRAVIADPSTVNINGDRNPNNRSESHGFAADFTYRMSDSLTLRSITALRDWTAQSTVDVDSGPAELSNIGNYPGLLASIKTNVKINNTADDGHTNLVEYQYLSQEFRIEGSTGTLDWTAGLYYQDMQDRQGADVELFLNAGLNGAQDNVGFDANGNLTLIDCSPAARDPARAFTAGNCNPTDDAGIAVSSAKHDADIETYAAFADFTLSLSDSLDVFAGFRFTQENLDVDFYNRAVLAPSMVNFVPIPENARAYTVDTATNTATIDLEANPLTSGLVIVENGTPLTPAPLAGYSTPVYTLSGAPVSDSQDNSDWSARLGASWQATDDMNFYLSASRSFIGYGVNLGRTGTARSLTPGRNLAFVEPTVAENIEIGIKSRPMDNLQVNAALYIMDVTDLQTTILQPDLTTVPVNAGDLDVQGLEADVVLAINDYLRLSLGLVYTDSEVKNLMQPCYPGQTPEQGCVGGLTAGQELGYFVSGTQNAVVATAAPDQVGSGGLTDVAGTTAPNTPEMKYNISLDASLPLEHLPFSAFGNITYTWQDDVHFTLNNDPHLVQEAYGLLDLTVGVVDKAGRYEASLFGKNVTDEEWYGAARENAGGISRAFHRQPRGAEAYYGARVKYNF